MCRVSNKLILCRCGQEIDFEKDHWMLNRFIDGKEELIIGETMLPDYTDPEIIKSNIDNLVRMLNQGNCFDFEVAFCEKDQLILFFNGKTTSAEKRMYAFEYNNLKWVSIETEPLMLNWYHDTIMEGYLKNSTSQKPTKQQ